MDVRKQTEAGEEVGEEVRDEDEEEAPGFSPELKQSLREAVQVLMLCYPGGFVFRPNPRLFGLGE